MKCWIAAGLALLFCIPAAAEEQIPFDVNARSAVLMDWNTGTVLYSKNGDQALPPASVTKVMTLLLIMEAVDGGNLSLEEEVSVSEYAASMGGSQVFLEAGETMQTEEMLKCVIIASANDAAVALAEKVAGSEEAFVARMNARARRMKMHNSHFANPHGLPGAQYSTAKDMALAACYAYVNPIIRECVDTPTYYFTLARCRVCLHKH